MVPEVVEEICTRLAGGEPLESICRSEHLPAKSTVLLAVVYDRDGFRTHYLRAREAAGFSHADSIMVVAEKIATEGMEPNAGRVIIDAMKWSAERMAQRHHSPKQEIENSGTVTVRRVSYGEDAGGNPDSSH